MKKFSLRALISTLLLVLMSSAFGAYPAHANGQTVTTSHYFLQGIVNSQLYSPITFTANGFPSTNITWSINPALPAGLTFTPNGSTATITGTPTAAYAPVNHTVTATDGTNSSITATFSSIQVSVASQITVTSNVTTYAPNSLITTPIEVNFTKDNFINAANGGVNLFITGLTTNSATCSNVTLSVAGTCTASSNQNGTGYEWTGVNFTAASSFRITVAANVFTTPDGVGQGSFAGLNINLSNNPGSPPQMNFGYAGIRITSTPSPSPSPPAATALIDLSAAIGDPVAGSAAPYSASGLQVGSTYDITVRSTPQIIEQGVVPSGGSISGTAIIPSGLAPGLHSITFRSVAADGTETKDVVWFVIGADGTLVSKSDTEPARLALTPAPPAHDWIWAFLILALGLGAFIYGREFNPEFMRVMSLVRSETGELEFVKRRIRSEDF